MLQPGDKIRWRLWIITGVVPFDRHSLPLRSPSGSLIFRISFSWKVVQGLVLRPETPGWKMMVALLPKIPLRIEQASPGASSKWSFHPLRTFDLLQDYRRKATPFRLRLNRPGKERLLAPRQQDHRQNPHPPQSPSVQSTRPSSPHELRAVCLLPCNL